MDSTDDRVEIEEDKSRRTRAVEESIASRSVSVRLVCGFETVRWWVLWEVCGVRRWDAVVVVER